MKREMTAAAKWIAGLGIGIYVALLIMFAYQTWELVDWLFPSENFWMKVVAVFAFDAMAGFWAALDMFYKFKEKGSKDLAQGMWFISFIFATAASGIQMYIGAVGRQGLTIDTRVVNGAYVLVIVAIVSQLAAMTFVLRKEWGAYADVQEPVRTSSPRPMGPPARVGLAQQGETKAPLTRPEPKEEA